MCLLQWLQNFNEYIGLMLEQMTGMYLSTPSRLSTPEYVTTEIFPTTLSQHALGLDHTLSNFLQLAQRLYHYPHNIFQGYLMD